MALKSVMVIGNALTLGAGLESLLSTKEDIHVIGINPTSQTEMQAEIERFRPKVIIMEECLLGLTVNQIMPLFKLYPRLRIIILSLENNHVQVYDKMLVTMRERADLFSLI